MPYIFVIDDNIEILDIICTVLESEGYPVLEFQEFESALEAYKKHYQETSHILLDMQLHDKTFLETIPAILKINQDARIIGMSGENANPSFQKQLFGFLNKPFPIKELLTSLL